MGWADDLLEAAHDQRLALLRQLLQELEAGAISRELRTVIAAHDDFMSALEAVRRKRCALNRTKSWRTGRLSRGKVTKLQ